MPAYAPTAPPQRQRTRRPARTLLLALIGVALVALAGLAIVSLTSQPSEVAYVNDDYEVPPPDTDPPPLPRPETYEQAEQWITANAFYPQTVPAPVRCDSQPINVTTASDEQLEAHFDGLMECLVRVWQPPITAADFMIVRPTVTIYGDRDHHQVRRRRGERVLLLGRPAALLQQPAAPGHPQCGQRTSGPRTSSWLTSTPICCRAGPGSRSPPTRSPSAAGTRRPSTPTSAGWRPRPTASRECSSGRCRCRWGSSRTTWTGIEATYVAIGDDTLTGDPNVVGNHGLARSRKFWGTRGIGTSAVGDCNTFVAPEAQVR